MMHDTTPKQTRKWLALTLITGCIACCAVPIITALGLSGAIAAMGAELAGSDLWLCVALLVMLGTGSLIYILRRRSKTKRNDTSLCATTCNVDQSCCNSTNKSLIGNQSDRCSLSIDQLNQRAKDFQILFTKFVRAERQVDTVKWYFQKGMEVENESHRLAALENTCCSSLHFNVTIDTQSVVWTIKDVQSRGELLELFYQLPTRIQTEDGIRELHCSFYGPRSESALGTKRTY